MGKLVHFLLSNIAKSKKNDDERKKRLEKFLSPLGNQSGTCMIDLHSVNPAYKHTTSEVDQRLKTGSAAFDNHTIALADKRKTKPEDTLIYPTVNYPDGQLENPIEMTTDRRKKKGNNSNNGS